MSNTQSRIQEQIENVCREATKKMMELTPIHPSISEELLKLTINSALRGAEIALEKQWIRVSEQLPDRKLVLTVGYGDVYICSYFDEYKSFVLNGVDVTHAITHWQPLPTPPKP